MSLFWRSCSVVLTCAVVLTSGVLAKPTITVHVDKPVGKVSPLHHGLMTEEINHCYDGGLYAELVQNRVFLDDPKQPAHWTVVQGNGSTGTISLDRAQPLNAVLPVSLRLDVTQASGSVPVGIANEGYWGIPVMANTRYRASFYAKAAAGFTGPVSVSIQSADGRTTYATATVPQLSPEWKSYEVALQTGAVTPTKDARYVLSLRQPGTVWFNLVSLFPPTWKNRPNGLRKDLMQMLVDLKPKFLRFPGGNYLEGDTIATRFDWKKTLGPLTARPGHQGPWGYRSTDGMGLMEFLLWCEDMGAEPVLGVYAGYSFKERVKAGPEMEPFVQEALEEIEYVTGAPNTKWGARRAADGHPAPFPLHYVEVGNEDFFDRTGSYDARFTQFYDAIKKAYPKLELISTVGFEQPEKLRARSRVPDAVDEHYYRSSGEFLKMAPSYYEKYDRKGPKIFVGEWAAYEMGTPQPWDKRAKGLPPVPNTNAAIGDAAWMLDMERNSDHVVMQCYAPLFVNVNAGAWQWRPNLIGYDALRSFGSPSYYAIKMFSNMIGDEILKVEPSATPVQTSCTRESRTGMIILKLVNPEASEQVVQVEMKGTAARSFVAAETTLSASQDAMNTLENPNQVTPVSKALAPLQPTFRYTVPGNGIVVLRFRAN